MNLQLDKDNYTKCADTDKKIIKDALTFFAKEDARILENFSHDQLQSQTLNFNDMEKEFQVLYEKQVNLLHAKSSSSSILNKSTDNMAYSYYTDDINDYTFLPYKRSCLIKYYYKQRNLRWVPTDMDI